MIPLEELNRFAKHVNACKKAHLEQEPDSLVMDRTRPETWFGIFNGYLYLLKANNISDERYEIARKVLQDITNWVMIGVDVETLEYSVPKDADNHVLMEI